MKHGHYSTPIRCHGGSSEYKSWQAMKGRCYRPKNASFKHYGERGITVCERWRNSFKDFITDMGLKPTPKHTIDRIDTNGNYEPSNCQWSDNVTQCNNKSNNVFYDFKGDRKTLAQISRLSGISFECLKNRIIKGKLTAEQSVAHIYGSKL